MTISEQQKKKLERLAKVLDGGNISLLQLLDDVEETLNTNVVNLDSKITAQIGLLRAELEKLGQKKQIILKGDPGTPGLPGKDYTPTEADKRYIASLIKVPIVEKVIEIQKTEVIKEQPIITEITKEVAVPVIDTSEDIRNKLELLQGDERLDAKAIKGLPEIEKKVASLGPANGPSGLKVYVGGTKRGQLREVNLAAGTGITLAYSLVNGLPTITFTGSGGFTKLSPTGTVNGSNKTFVFTSAPTLIIVDQGRAMQQTSSDGTVNWTGTTTVVLAIAPNFDVYGF